MARFRKKPVVIEAFRWTGGPDQTEDPLWIIAAIKAGTVRFENSGTPDVAMLIDTLEGTHRANQGDFIIQGVKGELWRQESLGHILDAYNRVKDGIRAALRAEEG